VKACVCALLLAAAPLLAAAGPDVPARQAPAMRPADAMTAAKMPALADLDGVKHRLSEWRGRVVLLNFWASWCNPCLKEIPDLVSAQADYRDRGLAVVGIGIDEARKLRNVVRTLAINYPVLVADPDSGGRLMQPWGNRIGIVPYTVVIDRDGRVAAVHQGPIRRDELDEILLPLLSAGPAKESAGLSQNFPRRLEPKLAG
jgi:peroxiredoxin